MILTKRHRISLMNALTECNEKIDIAKAIISKCDDEISEAKKNVLMSKRKEIDKTIERAEDGKSSFEIELFLAEKRKELIEEGLINNEIDF